MNLIMTTPTFSRHFRWHDYVITSVIKCIRTVKEKPFSSEHSRVHPCSSLYDQEKLNPHTMKQSARLMRVNHTGEVCAQALYLGQSLTTTNETLRQAFTQAAKEEGDHLQWCEQRLLELNSHKSYLNPLWFAGSLVMGTFAGLAGDRWSLGFLAETERQVFNHLNNHLEQLSKEDLRSRAIVLQMQKDEAEHATLAVNLGAQELPSWIKILMHNTSKIMTKIASLI